MNDIGGGLIEIADVSAVSELILFHVAHVSSVLWFRSFLFLLVASKNSHGLHVHTADPPEESLFEIFLDEMFASFILLILLRGLR